MRSDQSSLNAQDIEALVCRIFAELTGVESVSAEDNFFDLGGHSLLAIRLVSRIRKETGLELPLRSIFETATPAALAATLVRSGKNAAPLIKSGEGKSADGHLVLSWGQRRLWALDQIEGNSAAYNVALAFRLTGSLNPNVLAHAVEAILKRHSSLRTIVGVVDERPVGILVPTPDAETLLPIDIAPAADTQNNTSQALALWVAGQINEPFDLSAGLQFRARLYHQGSDNHALILLAHHAAAADGISMSILAREIGTAYSCLMRSATVQLPELPISYSDYAAWQKASLNHHSGAIESQSEYWRTRLAGAPELLSLPTDRTRNADRTRHSGFVPLRFDSQMAGALEALAREHDTTLFVVLLAGFAAMLSRLAGQEDVVIGAPVSNRNHAEIENLVGFFVNTLALRIDLSGDPDTATLIGRCRERVVSALSYQDVPFERLVELLSPPRSLGHTPLFQAMFEWQLQEPVFFSPLGLAVQPLPVILPRAKYDLTLCLEPRADKRIEGGIEYDATLFNHDTVRRWAAYLERVLQSMIVRPALQVNSFHILSDSERCLILQAFNQSAPIDATDDLIGLFRRQVSCAPDACAVVSGNNRSITYFDLDRQSERYARRLAEAGIGHDDIVAIALDRSIELMIILLAVIKAGAAFLPIDPDIPTARQLHMLRDSGARLLVTRPDSDLSSVASDLPKLLCPDEQNAPNGLPAREALRIDRSATLTSENLAYVIYTSGSTGAPKGVEISYASLSNLLFAMKEQLALGMGDNFLAVTTFGFDIALLELLVPILSGARVLLVRVGSGQIGVLPN